MKANINTIIIGGLGFVGINLTNLLLKNNRNITIITKKKNDIFVPNPNLKIIINDCTNSNILKKIFYKADEVVNLAYNSVPKTSFENPIKDINKNLAFTINIFEATYKAKVKKIINISTGGALYGVQNKFPIKENQPMRPISPYAITKLAIENYSCLFKMTEGLPIINLRPSNAYGIYQQPFTGQGIIANIMASVIFNKEFLIYGKNIIRDYLYISDLAKGIKASLDFGKIGKIYNLSTAKGTTNYQLLKKILKIIKIYKFKTPKYKITKARVFDVPKNILDFSKVYKDLGWKPRVNLNNGLEKSWQWYLKNLNKQLW